MALLAYNRALKLSTPGYQDNSKVLLVVVFSAYSVFVGSFVL